MPCRRWAGEREKQNGAKSLEHENSNRYCRVAPAGRTAFPDTPCSTTHVCFYSFLATSITALAQLVLSEMVHLRLNEKESRPNDHINFIAQLPCADGCKPSSEDAKELLRALAAQVKPLMKDHGFTVNSLEEVRWAREILPI